MNDVIGITLPKQGVTKMKKLLLTALLTALPHISNAQVEDGIYVIPEFNAYSVILTNNNVVKGYLFKLSGSWSELFGSRVDDVIELVEVTENDIAATRVSGSVLGATIESIYCNPFPRDGGGCEDDLGPFLFLPVLKATGSLKAIYQTQFGGDIVIFESDGIAVILIFEGGNQVAATDYQWIGAYTASISDNLAIFNLQTIVESEESDGEVEISFEAQISDRINPQAEFRNFSCEVTENDTQGETCEMIQSTYFSKLIRKF